MTFKFLNLDKFSKLIPQENNDLNKLNIKYLYNYYYYTNCYYYIVILLLLYKLL